MREVIQIKSKPAIVKKRKRVAAYARVSVDTDRLRHSLSAQVSYYNNLIQSNPEWEFKGVYADLGISGTSTTKREKFNELIEECNKGNIDIILTKSIQRFARNTVDLLKVVRDLKSKGVEVRFEKENINSMSGDGELMLSILASFAQEESRSISENIKWSIRKKAKEGLIYASGRFSIYGYRWEGYNLVPIPSEAKLIKRMAKEYLEDGLGITMIAKRLNEEGLKTRNGNDWIDTTIRRMLQNITYTGNFLFQKEYIADPITQKSKINKGELPQYYIKNTHEAIIPKETYDKIQVEFKRRSDGGAFINPAIPTTELTSKIRCVHCDKPFHSAIRSHKRGRTKNWICAIRKEGKIKGNPCGTSQLNHEVLKKMICDAMGMKEYDKDKVKSELDHIDVIGKNDLTFYLANGKIIKRKYISTARKDCWNEERKKQYSKDRRNKHKSKLKYAATPFTGMLECSNCGNSFRLIKTKLARGNERSYLSCGTRRSKCQHNSIKLTTLKRLTCEVLNINVFDEMIMDDQIERIYIFNNTILFHFKDGRKIKRKYLDKKERRSLNE